MLIWCWCYQILDWRRASLYIDGRLGVKFVSFWRKPFEIRFTTDEPTNDLDFDYWMVRKFLGKLWKHCNCCVMTVTFRFVVASYLIWFSKINHYSEIILLVSISRKAACGKTKKLRRKTELEEFIRGFLANASLNKLLP
jgi:hypothetical protein